MDEDREVFTFRDRRWQVWMSGRANHAPASIAGPRLAKNRWAVLRRRMFVPRMWTILEREGVLLRL